MLHLSNIGLEGGRKSSLPMETLMAHACCFEVKFAAGLLRGTWWGSKRNKLPRNLVGIDRH